MFQQAGGWSTQGAIYMTHPEYFDGTYHGVAEAIPAIADLGVATIVLAPIWQHEERSLFRIPDYHALHPAYGTDAELRALVTTAHEQGLKVLFDLVTWGQPPGGVAWNSGWMIETTLAELQTRALALGWEWPPKSGTLDHYPVLYHSCQPPPPGKNAGTCDFLGYVVDGGKVRIATYPIVYGPALDRTNPAAIAYFADVAATYVRDFDIDGWYIDYPANLWNSAVVPGNHSSLELLRAAKAAVTALKADAFFCAEQSWVSSFADSAVDEVAEISGVGDVSSLETYLHNAVERGVFDSDHLVDRIKREQGRIRNGRTRTQFVEHYGPRLGAWAPERHRSFVVLMSTVPGVPLLQAGQEVGATSLFFSGSPSVDLGGGDQDLRAFYRKVLAIRRSTRALQEGSIDNVLTSGASVYAYLRSSGSERVVVAVNNGGSAVVATLDLSAAFTGPTRLIDLLSDETLTVEDPRHVSLPIDAYGSRILLSTVRPARRRLGRAPGTQQ